MFREVRRKKNELAIETAKRLLINERRAVLAVNGDNGYPYAVPINFLYCPEEEKIYFHGSRVGHKIDSLKADDRVCLTVYGNVTPSEDDWAPYVQSIVVFGRCRLMTDQTKAIESLRKLAAKYYPDEKTAEEEVAAAGKAVQMLELTIEHCTGKQIQER